MAEDLLINNGVTIPGAELEITASRSGGPGGQHVNTSDTRIQLRWNVAQSRALTEPQRQRLLKVLASRLTAAGELLLAAEEHRSQRRNRDEARRRLAALVRQALVPPKPRKATRPTAASRRKRLQEKRQRSERKRLRRDGGDED